MDEGTRELMFWIAGVVVLMLSGLFGVVITLLLRMGDRKDKRDDGRDELFERASDRLRDKGETLATVSARVDEHAREMGTLRSGFEKIADALQRLARLEEWRTLAGDRLDEAGETSRTVVSLTEQNKTIFKRLDNIDGHLADMPRATAAEILQHVRPVSRPRVAHG